MAAGGIMPAWQDFKLSELKLDELNYRTGPQESQRDAILAIIADQEEKLTNLARDLLDMGPSPGEPIWVTADPEEPGRHVVLEGNRRVAALKLLENPALAEGTVVAPDFAEMAKRFALEPRRELEARVFASREDAEPWIERRHMSATSGVSLQPWRSIAKGRVYQARNEPVGRSLVVLDYLDDASDEFAAVKRTIEKKATTVDRVLNHPTMRDSLGVHIDRKTRKIRFENADEVAGRQLLRKIVGALAAKTFRFSAIRDEADRARFLSGFAEQSVKAEGDQEGTPVDAEAEPETEPATSDTKPRRPKRPHGNRPALAPSDNALHVTGPRLNRLYEECRKVQVDDFRNASALLLRVFLELSSEALLKRRSVKLPKNTRAWEYAKLSVKIKAVCDHLDPSGRAKPFQQARLGAEENSRSNYAVWTLHGYFHNLDLIPQPKDLKDAWDAWEAYLRAVTDDLSNP